MDNRRWSIDYGLGAKKEQAIERNVILHPGYGLLTIDYQPLTKIIVTRETKKYETPNRKKTR